MKQIQTIVATGLVIGALSGGGPMAAPLYAQDYDGFESIRELPDYPPSYYRDAHQPRSVSPSVPQPDASAAGAVPKPKGWLRRLLSPLAGKQQPVLNPPIDQQPKVSAGPPRETPVTPDPMIRLARGVVYGDTLVTPGFYLLHIDSGTPATDGSTTLSLIRQQGRIVSLPAKLTSEPYSEKSASAKPVQQAATSLPKPPETQPGKPARKEPESIGRVVLSGDGTSVTFVHQQGGRIYTSVPVPFAP